MLDCRNIARFWSQKVECNRLIGNHLIHQPSQLDCCHLQPLGQPDGQAVLGSCAAASCRLLLLLLCSACRLLLLLLLCSACRLLLLLLLLLLCCPAWIRGTAIHPD
jgi:hypothetical protein